MSSDPTSPPSGNRASPEFMVEELRTLPSGPRVLAKLQELLSDPNSGIPEFVEVVRLERSLMARVLKLANSPYYREGSEACESLEDAIARVGFAEVHKIVINAVGVELMGRPLETYRKSPSELWRDAVTCAFAAETIARATGDDPKGAYTLGLLQGVGMVVLNTRVQRFAPFFRFDFAGYPEDWSGAERARFGFTQADVAAAMLSHWNFPETMIEPIRCQYTPWSAGGHSRLAAVLCVSRWFRSVLGNGARPALPPLLALRPLLLSEERLDDLLPEIRDALHDAKDLLAVV